MKLKNSENKRRKGRKEAFTDMGGERQFKIGLAAETGKNFSLKEFLY